ncbi:MAG: flagellar hook-length control protein FliK [Alphaproteobacteria bacterium]
MAIENFFTLQIVTKTPEATGARPAGLLSTGLPGLDFLNVLFSQTDKKEELQKAVFNAANAPLQQISTREEMLQKKFELHLQKILAAHPEIAAQLKALPFDIQQQIVHTLALNQKAFDDVLKLLTHGTITTEDVEKGAPGLLHVLLAAVEKKQNLLLEKKESASRGVALDASEKLLQPDDKADTAMRAPEIIVKIIAHLKNLTPEQVNEIQIKVALLQKKNPGLSIEEALVEVIGFVPPVVVPPENVNIAPEIAAPIGSVMTPVEGGIKPMPGTIFTTPKQKTAGPLGGFTEKPNTAFGNPLTQAEDIQETLSRPQKTKMSMAESIAAKKDIHAAINLHASTTVSATTLSFDYSQNFYEHFNAHFNGQTINGPANFSTPLLHAPVAHAPVPATQLVGMTIANGAANGETKNITLQLEPEELGRVEVRLSFGKDKTVKAVLIAEKPETYAMLQRDSHMLERALQDAGLDSSGGLSFELADSGYNFNQDNQRGGGHDKGATGSGTDQEIEIVESSMTWQVDPATGHMRYSILA